MRGYRPHPWHPLVALSAIITLSGAGTLFTTPGVTRSADALPVSFTLPADAELVADEALATVDVPAPITGELDMGLVQRVALDTVGTMTAEEWDLEALSWSLEGDADAAFAFVRDRIGYEAYPGVLRGAAGTLAARAGNAYDRAVLLKTLLDDLLVPTRYAFGELDETAAAAVLARAFQAPTDPLPVNLGAATATLDAMAMWTRARRDYALLRRALGDRLDPTTAPDDDAAVTDPRRHVWVQMLSGSQWVDLDPTMADAEPGQTLTPATSTAAEIPMADRQTVRLQVVAETLMSSELESHPVLDETLDAAGSSDSEVFLYFQPAIGGIGGSIAQALGEATSYYPELMVDGVVRQGFGFPVIGATDIFSGGSPTGSPGEAALASLRLVVTRQAPGYPSDTFVRTFIERVPGSDRAAGQVTLDGLLPFKGEASGPSDLLPLHHIMISSGGANPRRLAVERAQLARFVGTHMLDPDEAGEYAMGDLLWPIAVADQSLVLASERAIVPGLGEPPSIAAYVARPRIFLSSIAPAGRGDDGISYETDLLADDVRILGPAGRPVGDAAARRVWYGAAEAAMETEFVLGIARGLDPATRRISAVSLAMQEPLTVIDAGDEAAIGGAAEALQAAVSDDLIAVVPGQPTMAYAWWTVDPTDGNTRSILDPGLGAGRGAGNNYVNSTRGNTYYVDDQGNSWVRKTAGPPQRCKPGQEYVALIGCVSVPAGWFFRGVGAAVAVAVAYGANRLWQAAIGP